ncbi:MAG: NfeD family protein [Acidimicrobiia bacterium]
MDDRQLLLEIESYWGGAGLSPTEVAEMKAELELHLAEAKAEGRSVSDVVGDAAAFAEAWATARRGRPVAAWTEVKSGTAQARRQARRDWILYGLGAVFLVTAAIAVGKGGSTVDNEVWRWLWTILAIVMAIGEIFTAGFFLLPFAIGAAAAAILAWLNVVVLAQWLVFFGVSIVSLAYLRRFIGRQDEEAQPAVGANRWIGSEGLVLQDIDPHTGAGMVKVLNEEWRATALQPIPANTRIVVTAVEGARLLVEPVEDAQ